MLGSVNAWSGDIALDDFQLTDEPCYKGNMYLHAVYIYVTYIGQIAEMSLIPLDLEKYIESRLFIVWEIALHKAGVQVQE